MSAIALRTQDVARHELGHAVVAVAQGWGVGRLSTVPDGNVGGFCEITPPQGRSSLQLAIEEITIRLAGRVACMVGDDSRDVELALDIASRFVKTDEEGQALCDYCIARAASFIDSASRIGLFDEFLPLIEERDGVYDFQREPQRDFAPLFEVRTAPITINVPAQDAPIVNVTMPEQKPPIVNVEAPDKLVTFHRNSDGEIIEAESTTAPVAA
jgi:hypothetical protein